LLAPAKNLELGIAAIDYDADAIYIGGPKSEQEQLLVIPLMILRSYVILHINLMQKYMLQ